MIGFLYEHVARDNAVTITPTSEATGYDADNLRNGNAAIPWRADTDGSESCVFNFTGGAVSIDAACIVNTNMNSIGVAALSVNSSDSWTPPSATINFDESDLTGILKPRNLYGEFVGTKTFQYWRLALLNPSSDDNFHEIGELVCGMKVVPGAGQNFETTVRQRVVRGNVEHETEWGRRFVYSREAQRELELHWKAVSLATLEEILTLERIVNGTGYPWVLITDRETAPYKSFYVRANSDVTFEPVTPSHFDVSWTVLEEPRGKTVPV